MGEYFRVLYLKAKQFQFFRKANRKTPNVAFWVLSYNGLVSYLENYEL